MTIPTSALLAPESPAMRAQRRRLMTLAIAAAALLGAAAGVLNSRGLL